MNPARIDRAASSAGGCRRAGDRGMWVAASRIANRDIGGSIGIPAHMCACSRQQADLWNLVPSQGHAFSGYGRRIDVPGCRRPDGAACGRPLVASAWMLIAGTGHRNRFRLDLPQAAPLACAERFPRSHVGRINPAWEPIRTRVDGVCRAWQTRLNTKQARPLSDDTKCSAAAST